MLTKGWIEPSDRATRSRASVEGTAAAFLTFGCLDAVPEHDRHREYEDRGGECRDGERDEPAWEVGRECGDERDDRDAEREIPDALREVGIDFERVKGNGKELQPAAAYLELHIEQGRVLLDLDLPLGAVLGSLVTFVVVYAFIFGFGRLTLSSLNFQVPGARAILSGVYSLDGQTLNFAGHAKLQAHLSQMVTGWKSWLLKPVDPFFAKNGAGTSIPIRITGTQSSPHFGLDF